LILCSLKIGKSGKNPIFAASNSYCQINLTKMNNPKENNGELSPSKQPLFRPINYILIGVCVLFLVLGYILISGGGSDDPEVFNPEIFNARRLVVAPTLMLIGIIVGVVAIMFRAKK